MLKAWPLALLALPAAPMAAMADDAQPAQTPVLSLAQGNVGVDVTSGTAQSDATSIERDTSVNLHLPNANTTVTGNFTGDGTTPNSHRKIGVDSKVTAPAGINVNLNATNEASDSRMEGVLVPSGVGATSATSETDSETATASAQPLNGVSLTAGTGATHTITVNNTAPLKGALQSASVIADGRQVFAKAEWSPFSFLKIGGGEKSESMDASTAGSAALRNTYRYDEPSTSATVQLWNGADAKASADEAVSPINTADFAALSAASGAGVAARLAPDREWRDTFGFDQTLDGAKLSASVTQARIQSTTELTLSDTDMVSPVSVSGGTRQEADVNFSLPLNELGLANTSMETQTTLRDSRIRDPITGLYRAVSGETPRQATVRIAHKDDAHNLQWGMTGALATDQVIYQPAEVSQVHTASGMGAFVQYKPGDYAVSLNVDGLVGGNRSQADIYYAYERGGSVDRWDRTENTDPLISLSVSRSF